jgi:hypothetical protein
MLKYYFSLIFICFQTSSKAQEKACYMQIPVDQIKVIQVDATDSVIIRSGPGKTFKSIYRLPHGWPLTFIKETDKVETISRAYGKWIQVSFKTYDGEVKNGYIFDYYTFVEFKPLKMVFTGVGCCDYCSYSFSLGYENQDDVILHSWSFDVMEDQFYKLLDENELYKPYFLSFKTVKHKHQNEKDIQYLETLQFLYGGKLREVNFTRDLYIYKYMIVD